MKIAIYGLGLIGGSLGRAIIKNTEHQVFGFDIDQASMLKAKMIAAVNDDLTEDNLREVDLVVLALNPSAAIKVMRDIVPQLKNGATVIDCCGNKTSIVNQMKNLSNDYPNISFVGVHPMAGREFSGISHSTAGLFDKAYFILTPVDTQIDKLALVRNLFIEVGCEGVVVADAKTHDKMIAYTSQLAHVISNAYIRNDLATQHLGFSAGSFRDMTRVSKLNADMWTELFLDNRENLIEQVELFKANVDELLLALRNDDSETLHKILEQGTKIKEQADSLKRTNK